ncbi:MAG: beta-propeller fold lactonase family protein [Acidobacteriia bacterium]|nr:beta-propeller fold lactonase family protein [Methyloceanibacter sp.]MBX5471602.1 beta-propeller fold lactonase family protein [Acetobacteraceae bacterium]MCL6492675.1 beta-propeller fold lactonase family protein [Terriglobia bacterium]
MQPNVHAKPGVSLREGLLAAALTGVLAFAYPAFGADFALSGNDNHTTVVDGKPRGLANPKPDNVSVIDLGQYPPRLLGTVEVPYSDIGPPTAIAVAPDGSFAIVSSSTRADAASPDGAVPDNRVSVLDLTVSPPKVIQQVQAGMGATTVRISPDGHLVLVANRNDGTLSIFTLAERHLTPAGTFSLGNPKSIPQGLVISKDGKTALVSRAGDHIVSLIHINGTTLSLDPRPITTGVTPDTMDIDATGRFVVVTNVGRGDGDVDTISLIDLSLSPPRTVDTVAVPSGPESAKFSPNGKYIAVSSINGSIKSPGNPFYHEHGILTIFALEHPPANALTTAGRMLRRVAQVPLGGWAQGIAFSRDGHIILGQNFREHSLAVFRFSNGQLERGPDLPMPGGPAAFATPWP